MTTAPRILIAGGGSLGSVYPGLSIARRLLAKLPGATITLAGDGRAIERHTVCAAGLRYATVPRAKRPTGPLKAPSYAVRNVAGWCVANWLLREQEIDLVVSLGGHAAGPVVRAARSTGIPFLLVEQNSLPNPTTLPMAGDASLVCLAREETAASFAINTPILCTGGVGRPGFEDTFSGGAGWVPPTKRADGRQRLVVLGGIGNATSLNESMPLVAGILGGSLADWQIVHQAGSGWLQRTERLYREHGAEAVAVTYIDELAHLLRQSDLVVCRSSGSMLAELALAGLPAILVPDSRHDAVLQRSNAEHAQLRAGCPVIDESTGDLPAKLADKLGPLLIDPLGRYRLSERLAADARPNASDAIAAACCDLLGVGSVSVARQPVAA